MQVDGCQNQQSLPHIATLSRRPVYHDAPPSYLHTGSLHHAASQYDDEAASSRPLLFLLAFR